MNGELIHESVVHKVITLTKLRSRKHTENERARLIYFQSPIENIGTMLNDTQKMLA